MTRQGTRICCLIALAGAVLAAPARAQSGVPSRLEMRHPPVDVRLLVSTPVHTPGSRLDRDLAPAGIGAVRSRRPWWLIPLVAAGAGAVLYEVARGDECEQTDCTVYIPPPVQGAVLGLAVGTVIEVVLRVSDR
jgi:hypothetical protein